MPELPEGWLRLDAPDFPDGHGQQAGLIEAPLEIPPAAHGDEGPAGALAEAGAAGVVCAVLAGGRRETGKKEAAAEDFGKN